MKTRKVIAGPGGVALRKRNVFVLVVLNDGSPKLIQKARRAVASLA